MEFREGGAIRNSEDGLEGVVLGFDLETGNPVVQMPLLGDELQILVGSTDTFEDMGDYERKVSDPESCGLGKGEKTCAYLFMGPRKIGFICARFSNIGLAIEEKLKEGIMDARGKPISMRPGCQQEIQDSLAT